MSSWPRRRCRQLAAEPRPAPGTGKPPAGTGINTAAAFANPLCDKNAGPYGRLDFVVEGGGPVCVAVWKEGKDNGGATYQGVTKDTIKVVVLVPNEQQMAAVPATERPIELRDRPARHGQDVFSDALAAYEHIFGGPTPTAATIELEFVTSTGDDEAAQRADAVTVKAKKPFVVIDSTTRPSLAVFDTEIVAAKIPVFSLNVTRRARR